MLVLGWLVAGACVLFLAVVGLGLAGVRSVRYLDREAAPAVPEAWPRLSVIIPALNEGNTLEAALQTLLAQSYPKLEIILINDRSTDTTGEIVNRLAATDPRIRAVHITELPPNWLGKLHALHRGTELATGDWLLYSDADVHFEPGVLERAISIATSESLDQLAILPSISASNLGLEATLVSFAVSFMLMVRPHRVGRPGSKAFIGVGAFNLVRRSTFDRTPGFEWLRMEVADDVGLGKLMVDAGGKPGWRLGGTFLTLEWYDGVASLIRGLEKNTYGIFSRFSAPVFFAKFAVIGALWSAPVVALIVPPFPDLRWLALAVLAAVTLLHVVCARQLRYSWLAGLLAPFIGSLVLVVTLWNSALSCWRQGGVRWRGTLYSAKDLRAGQRLKL